MVAAAYFADGTVPRRGELPLAGSLICYRPYECADGWVSLGALEPKFWQAWCRGVGREDLIEQQFERPGSEAHGQVQEIFKARPRADWEAFAREHDCCLEPVLELDEALSSELVRERGMVVEIDQPGAEQPVRQLGIPVKLTRTPGEHARLPGPALGEHTEEVLRAAGYSEEEVAELLRTGAVAGPAEAPNERDVPGVGGDRRTWARRVRPATEVSRDRSRLSGRAAHHHRRSAPVEDQRAGRALGRERRHDQALPARGPARRRGRDRQDESQHGLLPARADRAGQVDQAPAGGAVHAAADDQGGARGGPRARARAGGARGPHPRARARGRRGSAGAPRRRRFASATRFRATCSSAWRRSAC